MSNFDRELEKGIEDMLKMLVEPPRVYFVALIAFAIFAWWRWGAGPIIFVASHQPQVEILGGLAALLLIAALLGARHARSWWQGRSHAANLVADWPELAEGLALQGSSVLRVQPVEGGQAVRLQLNRFRGQTSADLVAKLPRLESALRVRPGAVRVLPDLERADLCTLRVVERDPLAKPIPWTPPKVASITEPIALGLFEDRQPVQLRLWEADRQRHVLIAGVNGSGKSGLINVVLGSLANCRDVSLWGIDLKGGMEFAAWQPVLDRVATAPIEADRLLEAANRALDARMALLAGRRWRRWRPSPDEPLIVLVVDEISELTPEGLGLVQRLARLGRAPGVQLIVATQRPSAKQLESTDESGVALRGQLHTRICMRVTETREADMILGGGMTSEGWRADRLLREPGTFLISDAPEHMRPIPARCYWMSDATVRATVAASQALRPRLDVATMTAAAEPLELAEGVQEPREPAELPEDPDTALLEALRRAGTASPIDLAAQTGQSRAAVYGRLDKLAAQGAAKKVARGRWGIV